MYEPSPNSFVCSIVIPVCNKLELTRQCLIHLAEVTHGCTYEVIVVDNGSTDGTKEFLVSLGGDIQVITNDSNQGFAIACNQGAKAAKGKYVVFLNNDTIPQTGWLSALVNEAEQHADVAIVGSKLLYPNNTIQHAGVVFSKISLTPYHLFNGVKSDFPAANIRQEFQAVTAACLLIRQKEFLSVGGFDEDFRNGFEDVDLCLKIRESGKKVIYQPKSVLYHLEEQTPGRKDPETEQKNGFLLMDRWAGRIVVDEDIYPVTAGYANRYSRNKEKLGLAVKPFKNTIDKLHWEHVKNLQELLLKKRYDKSNFGRGQIDEDIRSHLVDVLQWPEDIDTLKWAATMCAGYDLPDSEGAFLRQVLCLGEDRDVREKFAREALKCGDLQEASQHVEALLNVNANDGLGLWLRGILSMQSLEYTQARESFQQALANGFDEQKAELGLGMAWMGIGDASQAWDKFSKVLATNPDNQEAVNGVIQAGTALERWEEMLFQLTRYLDRNPANCDIRFVLAGVCYRAGKFEMAQKHFETLQIFAPNYEGLELLKQQLQGVREERKASIPDNNSHESLYDHQQVQSYSQSATGNTETYIRVLPSAVLDHTVIAYKALHEYEIADFGRGIAAVEAILPIVFQRQFSQPLACPFDMWDRVAVLTVDCQLTHGPSGQSFSSFRPETLEDINENFAQQEGAVRKKEIFDHLAKLRNGEHLGMPLYISGEILRYLGAPAEKKAIYMLDGARRLAAAALHHQERISVTLLVFEEEFSKLLKAPVKTEIQHRIQQLTWFQNYHSFPFLEIEGQRSLQRFKLLEKERLQDSVIVDFGCNLGQASVKALQCGAKEVWGIEGMQDTLTIAEEIKSIVNCKNLHYLHVDFNDPQFDKKIDEVIPGRCDYAFFFSVYRTKELTQRDRLFQYILNKTQKGVFFEGHAHPQIDTIEYYDWLFDSFQVPYTFLGFSEQQTRPLFYLDLESRNAGLNSVLSRSKPSLDDLELSERLTQPQDLINSL